MSRIVIDARKSGTTTGRYIDQLVAHLHDLDAEHEFYLLAKTHRLDALREHAPSFVVVPTRYEEFTVGEQVGLRRTLRDLDADLVHFPMAQQPIFYSGAVVTSLLDLTTLRFRNPARNPFVYWAKQRVYGRVVRRAARRSAAVICLSDYVRRDVSAYTGRDIRDIHVTHCAADPIADAPVAVASLAGRRFIMHAGRALPHKNVGRLIDAFRLLQPSHPDLVLALAGPREPAYLQHEAAAAANDTGNIAFVGHVSDAELRWMYEHTACYVFPSLSEGFGLPGLEAMAHGAPVASSTATCLPEIYGEAAAYFDPMSDVDMASSIATVLGDADVASALRLRGYEQAARYSWHRMAEQTLHVYELALAH